MMKVYKMLPVLLLSILLMNAVVPTKAQAPYCEPTYTTGCSWGDGLVLFQLNTINQPIACDGVPNPWYHDYTDVSTDVIPGFLYDLVVEAGYTSTYVSVWVDWNNDNTFSQAELMVDGVLCEAPGTNTVIPFTIPDGIPDGTYRLRFRTNWLSAPTGPCDSHGYGNSADFTLTVGEDAPTGPIQIVIGTGTLSSSFPYYTFYMDARTQVLITADEMMLAGGAPGEITKIGFEVITANPAVMNGFTISGQTTDITTLSAFVEGGWTELWFGNFTVPGPGWHEHVFNVPLFWDGQSNILFDFCFDNNAWTSNSTVYATSAPGRTYARYMDSTIEGGCTMSSTQGFGGAQTNRPNIGMEIEPLAPAEVEGIVLNANTMQPVTGAVVNVGGATTTTLANGQFSLEVWSGPNTVVVTKPGFESYVDEIFLDPGDLYQMQVELLESTNPPGAVLAALNTAQTAVNLNWGLPSGPYEILYDDGWFENITAWSQEGSINALRFTPIAHPVTILSGSIHVGDGSYPPAQNIPNTFEVAIFAQDASPFGWPGEELARFEVNRGGEFGWVTFDLPEPVTITSDDFYIGMVQMGNFPNTVGIAIDESNPVNRSYAKFVTGPWSIAGYQDFMIRAIVSGPGGPWGGGLLAGDQQTIEPTRAHREAVSLNSAKPAGGLVGEATYVPVETGMPAPEDLMGYNVYRFVQGDEGDESAWTALGTPSNNAFVDNGWPALPDGAYRWAVKARYTGDRMSPPTFSNVLGKGFTVDAVTFNLALSNGATPTGIEVVMVNQLVPDSTYASVSGDDGIVVYNDVWKGTYDITVYKFGFELWTATEEITSDKTYNVMLWQLKNPPDTPFEVDERTLMATWGVPLVQALIFEETFSSGSFATNDWDWAPNWQIVTFFGNPAPAARFNWSPAITNYDVPLTSKLLTGVGSPEVQLFYDIHLSNFGTTYDNKMAVEVWDGVDWINLKTYINTAGSFPWTSEVIDITEHVGDEFRIRFRAYGDDSYDINNWDIDNVRVLGVETDVSVMGYNFYLDDVQIGFIAEATEYQIPPALITYGETYLAEVAAVYQSGVSPRIGTTFTSYWLAAPWDLAGVNVENAVQLTWEAPFIPEIVSVISSEPRSEMPDPNTEYSPMHTQYEYVANRDLFDPLYHFPHWNAEGEYPVASDGNHIYTARWNSTEFYKYQLDGTYVETFTVAGVSNLRDLTYDGQYFYGSNNSSTIYEIDLANQTLISSFSTSVATVRAIAYDQINDAFWVSNGWNPPLTLVSRTGATLESISTSASSFAGLGWENVSDGGPYLWGYCQTGPLNDLVQIDITTGATLQIFNVASVFPLTSSAGGMDITPHVVDGKMVFLGASQNDFIWVLELGDFDAPGPVAEGLLGYNIYRNGQFHAFVEVPELEFWDLNMLPGTYKYTATGLYDLEFFGLTGEDESLHSNEIEIGVNDFGYPLPFIEEWESANYGFNNWILSEDDDNHWRISTAQGNPVPAAEFTWSPPVKEYWYALTSPPLNAAPYTCADIYLDFDIKLNDRNATEDEKLIVQHFVNGSWIPLKEFKNSGSFDWTSESIQMPQATGKTFHIRFVATGDNTADILSWFIDNIHVYAECRAPMDLMGQQVGWDEIAYLEWVEPDCETGPTGELVKLSQWDGAPENAYFQSYGLAYGVVYDLAAYPDATLEFIDFHHASWGVLGTWDYNVHVVDWSTYQLIETFGPFQTTGNDKWENGILIGEIMGYGGGLVGIMLEPLSNSPTDAYPCFSADNNLTGVSVFGEIPNWSAFAASGVGDFLQNLWIRTNFAKDGGVVKLAPVTTQELEAKTRVPVIKSQADELVQQSKLIPSFDNATKDSPVEGYNVYRSDDLGETFNLITPAPITELSYTDLDVVYYGEYQYYTTALFDVCESVASNIAEVSILVGIDEVDGQGISIYPIPATTQLTITVSDDIRSLRVLNYLGQTVYDKAVVKDKVINLNTSEYAPGVYLVQFVDTEGELITRRVVISK